MIFHPEQTSWASQREESIDLPGSNHNTSTFPQVYFLAFYQDFINYFGWQIDLLLCPLSLLSEGKLDCELNVYVCLCKCVCARVCVDVCGYARMGVCVSSALEASSAIWPQSTGATWWESKCHWSGQPMPSTDKWRQEKPTLSVPKQTTPSLNLIPSWPLASLSVACNDGDGDPGTKAYPSVALSDSSPQKRAECLKTSIIYLKGLKRSLGSVEKMLMAWTCGYVWTVTSSRWSKKTTRSRSKKK